MIVPIVIIGIPKEIKAGETRVAVAPEGVARLVRRGHQVIVQSGAGLAAGWSDRQYRQAGARLCRELTVVYKRAQLICKVKEPLTKEIRLLRSHHILFTFLHLAGNPALRRALSRTGCVAIAYESITSRGALPILASMSEVAGRIAMQLGAQFLRPQYGGKGVLLRRVGVIGCGHVGQAAIDVALGLRADVMAIDAKAAARQRLKRRFGKKLRVMSANANNLRRLMQTSDVVIGAVLSAGHRAPRVVSAAMVKEMEAGSVIVDVAIDEGGCVATSQVTSISKPTFIKYGVVHCAIPNLPALVPRTASQMLADKALPYLLKLAKQGYLTSLRDSK